MDQRESAHYPKDMYTIDSCKQDKMFSNLEAQCGCRPAIAPPMKNVNGNEGCSEMMMNSVPSIKNLDFSTHAPRLRFSITHFMDASLIDCAIIANSSTPTWIHRGVTPSTMDR